MTDARFVGDWSLTDDPKGRIDSNGNPVMIVDSDFSFIDSRNVRWDAHKGTPVGGAHIPGFLKWVVGGAYQQPYLPAAVLHDIYCTNKSRTWGDTDRMFREAMVTNGTNAVRARAMWLSVYFYHLFGHSW